MSLPNQWNDGRGPKNQPFRTVLEEWVTSGGMVQRQRHTKEKWVELEQSFKTRFPNTKKATKTAPKLERELGAMRITMEELGKMEKYRREDVYMHMVLQRKSSIWRSRQRLMGRPVVCGMWGVNYQRSYAKKYQKTNPAGPRSHKLSKTSTWDIFARASGSTKTELLMMHE